MRYKIEIANRYIIIVNVLDKSREFALLLTTFLDSNMFNMSVIQRIYNRKNQYGLIYYGEGVYYSFNRAGVHIWDWEDTTWDREEDMSEGMFIEYDDLFKIAKRFFEQPKNHNREYENVSDEIYDTETDLEVDINMY